MSGGGAGVVIESSPPRLLWRGAWERGAGTRPSPSVAWPPWIPRREEPRASSRVALSMNDRKYHRAHVSSVSRDPSQSPSSNPPPPAPQPADRALHPGHPLLHPSLPREAAQTPPPAGPAALSPRHKHLLVLPAAGGKEVLLSGRCHLVTVLAGSLVSCQRAVSRSRPSGTASQRAALSPCQTALKDTQRHKTHFRKTRSLNDT